MTEQTTKERATQMERLSDQVINIYKDSVENHVRAMALEIQERRRADTKVVDIMKDINRILKSGITVDPNSPIHTRVHQWLKQLQQDER